MQRIIFIFIFSINNNIFKIELSKIALLEEQILDLKQLNKYLKGPKFLIFLYLKFVYTEFFSSLLMNYIYTVN